MTTPSEVKFKRKYQTHRKHLKLKGLQPKTIEAYSRAIRRIGGYFNHQIDDLSGQQLTDYFCDLLGAITREGLALPASYPEQWVVDCKHVGTGEKALIYLGRYLYKGVVQEKAIIACRDGKVTFRYQNSKTRKMESRTVTGARFLWLLLQHVLPKGFRRARNFGFLHPNSKRLIGLLQYLLELNPNRALQWIRKRPQLKCRCCGAAMKIVQTRIPPPSPGRDIAQAG